MLRLLSHRALASSHASRSLSVLILGEFAGKEIAPSTRAAVTAARQCGSPVTVLLVGEGASSATSSAASVDGVDSVHFSEAKAVCGGMAEGVAGLMSSLHSKNSERDIATST